MKALQFTGSLPNYALTMALGRLSRAAHWGPLSCVALREVPEPALPGPDWAVVRTRYGGICGSDIHLILLQTSPTASAFTSFPFTVGHENVGRLAEVGEGVGTGAAGAAPLRVGQRVVVDLLLPCAARGISPPCRPCQAGNFPQCENFTRGALAPGIVLGGCRDTGGSWGPFFLAHRSQIFPVPDNVSDEAAVLVEPLSVSLHAAARALRRQPAGRQGGGDASLGTGSRDGDTRTTLVIGGGIIGLGVVASLRYLGDRSRVVALARHGHQADLARTFGADEVITTEVGWERRLASTLGAELHRPIIGRPVPDTGAGLVFECAGSSSALDAALRFAAPGGQVVLAGLASTPKGVDWSFIWRKELLVAGTFCSGVEEDPREGPRRGKPARAFELALDLLASGRHDFASLVTHRFRLEDYRRAFGTVLGKGRSRAVKAVFEFDEAD